MPITDQKQPSMQMLDNLDLLLNMDVLLGESDWNVVEKLDRAKAALTEKHAKDKGKDKNEDDDGDQ